MSGTAPLRVLQVITRPQRRGAEVSARQLADALVRRGHETQVLALYGGVEGPPLPMGERDVALGGDSGHPLERLPGVHPGLLRRLGREIRRFAPDVVQVNGSRTVKYGAAAAAVARGRRWALVYRNIGDPDAWQSGAVRRIVYGRLVMRRMDGVASGSARNLERVVVAYGLRVPAAVIPRGVDVELLAPRRERAAVRAAEGTAGDRPLLLYLGSLTAEKRVDLLLAAAARLHAAGRPAGLWLAGDGPCRDALERQASGAGIGGSVRFLGAREEVGELIAAADLLVLASDTEGTPGAVLEAAALGVPAVATRVGGTAECVLDGETGLLVPPGDAEALAAAVAGLLADPALRRQMGERARQRIESGFRLADVAARTETFYRQVLAQRRGGPGAAA